MKSLSSVVPLDRLGTPDEIAKAVVFLASEDGSYVTRTELFVDGVSTQVWGTGVGEDLLPDWHICIKWMEWNANH